MLRRLAVAALFASSVFLLSYSASTAATKTINKPMFNGNRLDWCMKWSEDCGRPVADAYCKIQGYVRATFFVADRHIGARTPTRLIGTGATCDLNHCDGFRQIVCLKRPTVATKNSATPIRIGRPFERAARSYERSVAKRYAPMRLASAGPVIIKPPIPVPRPATASVTPRQAAIREISSEALTEEKIEGTGTATEAAADGAKKEPDRASTPAEAAPATEAQPVTNETVATAKVEEPATTKTFEKPMYNGKRLAWCHEFDSACGRPAADAFCKANGFTTAAEFTQDPHIGDVAPTRSIGSGAVCDQVPCDGFKVIACTM